jgi:porin
MALGMQYQGPLPDRPADTLGAALGTNHLNNRIAADERLLNEVTGTSVPVQGSEYVAEIFYGWKPRSYLTLRPNVQYVRHPGGSNEYGSIVVIGLKSNVVF